MARKKVAYRDGMVAAEKLPLPVVLYPGHYGTFIGFQTRKNADIVLCSCAKLAVENYIRFRLSNDLPEHRDPCRRFLISASAFPRALVESLLQRDAPRDSSVRDYLTFQDAVCHECNKVIPRFAWCDPMYGGEFSQAYGWYVNQESYKCGVEPLSFRLLTDACLPTVMEVIDIEPQRLFDRYIELQHAHGDQSGAYEVWKRLEKQKRRIRSEIEDRVRVRLGYPKIGEGWMSETLLFKIVEKIFPSMRVIHHHHPEFLGGMELDIYVSQLALGIEYQGLQHYEPVACFGGEEGLRKVQERDKRKKELCAIHGVTLICIRYDEDLTEAHVRSRLKDYIP